MNVKYRTKFLTSCPKTRKDFVEKYRNEADFRNRANSFDIYVVGESVVFPNGKIANPTVK